MEREIRARHAAPEVAITCLAFAILCAISSVTTFTGDAYTSVLWVLAALIFGAFAVWHFVGSLWQTTLTPHGLIQRRMGQTMQELPWKDVQRAELVNSLRVQVETWSGLVVSIPLPNDAPAVAEMMEVGLCRGLHGNRVGSERELLAKRRWRALVHGWDSVMEFETRYQHANGYPTWQLNPFQERLVEAIKFLVPLGICLYSLNLWGWGPAIVIGLLVSFALAKLVRRIWVQPLFDGEIELVPGLIRFHQPDGGFIELPFTGWKPQQRWITAIQEFSTGNQTFRIDLASLMPAENR